MCAEYEIRTAKEKIDAALGRRLMNSSGREVWEARIKLSLASPVIVENGSELELVNSTFPVRPFPNARLSGSEKNEEGEEDLVTRIYDRPTWRRGFVEERCVAVMTAFFEPAYWGPDAGKIMRFAPPQGELFFVAAIRIRAQIPKVERAHALLTHVATDQMLTFHHRLLLLLSPGDVPEWLAGGKVDPVEKFDFLLRSRLSEDLRIEPERQMAKGWQKRVEHHEEALENEKLYVAKLGSEGVEG